MLWSPEDLIRRWVRQLIILFLPLCSIVTFSPPEAVAGRIDLKFEEGTLSASLVDAPLPQVVDFFRNERGIWVKGGETLGDETLSAEFKGLPFEEGIKRIFSGLNHSLVFDRKGTLLGIMLLGGGSDGNIPRRSRAFRTPSIRRPPYRR